MLRVGLTGNLGSGKSTVARLFAARGAHILQSDSIGRDLMQPGQAAFAQIVDHFGPSVLTPAGDLDRQALARIAFAEGRAEELNAIVHPAVIARQAELAAELAAREPSAVLLVESALIFETRHGAAPNAVTQPWHTRFDQILLVTAPAAQKIARFIRRSATSTEPRPEEIAALEQEAQRRLALQLPDEATQAMATHILVNDHSLDHLEQQVEALWPTFQSLAAIAPDNTQVFRADTQSPAKSLQ